MWNYDKALDIYRLESNPNYYVDTETNKMFPGWKNFYLCNEREELSWKLISTDIHAALEEAAPLVERLEAERPWEKNNDD